MKKIAIILAAMIMMTGCNNIMTQSQQEIDIVTIVSNTVPLSPELENAEEVSQADTMTDENVKAASNRTGEMPSANELLPNQVVVHKPEVISSVVPVVPSEAVSPSLEPMPISTVNTKTQPEEVRAMWISYLDFYTIAQGKTKAEFTANIDSAFKELYDYGINTVYVQVRPYGDTLYPSKLAPWSHTINADKIEGVDPGYDPLQIMIDSANKYDFFFEAWLNPFRIRSAGTKSALSNDNPAKALLANGDRAVVEHSGSISYNPASSKARQMIVNVVVELIENYDIDGIHFDDYFYPTTDKAFDQVDYTAYQNAGGKLAFADWRRENVNKLIREVYSAIKKHDETIVFGISPQAKMENNYHAQFVDVEKMINEPGYIDYVCPQIYFGFENESMPYSKILKQWNDMVAGSGKELYIGLGPYKCGVVDNWAGAGKTEWIEHTDITKRMVLDARNSTEYDGFAIFRSEYFFRPPVAQAGHIQEERANLKSILN